MHRRRLVEGLFAALALCAALAVGCGLYSLLSAMPDAVPEMRWPEEMERLKMSLRGAERACESYRREIAEAEDAGDAVEAAKLREALRQTEAGVVRLRARIAAGR